MDNEKVIDANSQAEIDKINAYKSFFESADGQIVLYDLMEKGYFLSPTLADSGDQYATARNEGMRELVVYILSEMKRDARQIYSFIKHNEDNKGEYHDD